MEKSGKNLFKVTSELIAFAHRFSKSYKSLNPQIYNSPDSKLTIKLDYNKNFGAAPNNFWRIETASNNIEIAYDYIFDKEIDSDFIYFMIIWSACFIYYKTTIEAYDYVRADKETMAYYQTTGRSLKSIVKGYVFMFQKWVPSDERNNRLKFIFDNTLSVPKKEPKKDTSWLVDNDNKTVTLYPMHLKTKSYKLFLDKQLRAPNVTIEDIFQKIEKRMRAIYVSKGYKIFFSYKIHKIQLI